MLDTQEYLRRSGRVSWVKAGLGKMLRIRLLVEVVDGQVERRDLIRTRRKAIDALTQMVRSWGPLHRLALLHTAAAEEAAALAESLASLSTSPPLVVEATTLLGAHVGPAALGAAALLP
jgi:fatty acid-binding protein DegV